MCEFYFSPSPTSRKVYLYYTLQIVPVVEKATKQLQKVYGNYAFSSTLHHKCCGRLSTKSSNIFVFTVLADTVQHHVPFTPDSERPKQ